MKQSAPVGSEDLLWTQPRRLDASYRLAQGPRTVATLRFASGLGSRATGEGGGSRWTFKRVGFFRPRVTVRIEGSEVDLAVFELGWSWSGFLSFSSGRRYRWTSLSFWRLAWAFVHEDGCPLVHFSRYARGRRGAPVHVERAAKDVPDLMILLLLGWYLLVLMDRDGATAAATFPAVTSA